ncbi:uncharacterized protein [Drosophila tropicalis]|uniref:uncharacterized protein n=1 Tax=Drosophila tropicalis TaxID=46794 RepID=UPI0035ABDD14
MDQHGDNQIPKWIRADLFEDMLKNQVKDFSKIKSFSSKAALAPGENFATIMLRIAIEVLLNDGKPKTISYMLKLPHQTEIFEKMNEKLNMFDIERNAYQNIIPELEELYRNVGLDVTFGAQSFELAGVMTDYLLLEDLQPKGFKNASRLDGLNQEHTKRVLHKLAQWHAASAVRVLTKGPYEVNMTCGYFKEENREMMMAMGKEFSKNFVQCCATYKGNEAYIEDVKALQHNMVKEMFNMAKLDTEEFNVLNHGDLWSNNIMFKYDAFDKIKEVFFVDHQLPRYGSVVQDLYYFLLSSTKLEDKLDKFDENIKYYHDSLVEHLKLLNYSGEIPKLQDIHLSLIKRGMWGYNAATGVMSVVLLDPNKSANLETFFGDSEDAAASIQTLSYSNARYRKHIQKVLPWLHNRGAMETN